MDRTWARTGGVFGLLSVAGYLSVLFVPMPPALLRLVFFFLPLAGILWAVGLYRLLRARADGVILQAAALFGITGFAVMNMMAVVQNSIHVWIRKGAPAAADPATREMAEWVRRSVNAVQLGLDVSFDIFVLSSVILFGVAMMRHPRFGRAFGITGCAIAAVTLGLNLYTFPVPPEPDLGPFVGLWLLAVSLRMLVPSRYGDLSRRSVASGGSVA